MEIHNARYEGAFKCFGETLIEHHFFDEHRIFATHDIRRMGDLLFCLTIVVTMLSGYFHRDDDIEEYLSKYNDEFPQAEEIKTRINKVLSIISKCDFTADNRVWKKADFFTLFIEIDKVLSIDMLTLSPTAIAKELNKFYKCVDLAAAGKSKDEIVQKYYKAALQASNDRSNRIARGEIIGDLLTSK